MSLNSNSNHVIDGQETLSEAIVSSWKHKQLALSDVHFVLIMHWFRERIQIFLREVGASTSSERMRSWQVSVTVTASKQHFVRCSSPRAFPITWGHRNGIEYHSSTLFCRVRPPPLTPPFPHIFHMGLYTCFVCFAGASNIAVNHVPISLFVVTFFFTCAAFTDPLTCSFLISSCFVTLTHQSIQLANDRFYPGCGW